MQGTGRETRVGGGVKKKREKRERDDAAVKWSSSQAVERMNEDSK